MRGGRPLPVLLAAASMVVAGMGVSVANVERERLYDEPIPPRRRSRLFDGKGTNAIGPHTNAREIARRLRQAARNAERQSARVDADIYFKAWRNNGVVGLSRRGRFIKAATA